MRLQRERVRPRCNRRSAERPETGSCGSIVSGHVLDQLLGTAVDDIGQSADDEQTEYGCRLHLASPPTQSHQGRLRAAKLPLTRAFLRYSGDAFLQAFEAELRIAEFMSGFETSMAPLWCGRHEVALQFRNARTHLPSVVLTQRLDPIPPAHQSSCQHPPKKAMRVYPSRP